MTESNFHFLDSKNAIVTFFGLTFFILKIKTNIEIKIQRKVRKFEYTLPTNANKQ